MSTMEKLTEICEEVKVISKTEVENLWNEKSRETRMFYPKNRIEKMRIKKEDSNDYYIIYLSGASIKKMIFSGKVKTKTSLWHRPKDIADKGNAGYYLVKLTRPEIEGIVPEEQDLLGLIPHGWRRATTREALETILNVSLITKRNIYEECWHISKAKSVFKNGKIDSLFNLMNLKDGVLMLKTKTEETMPAKVNSITVMKLRVI